MVSGTAIVIRNAPESAGPSTVFVFRWFFLVGDEIQALDRIGLLHDLFQAVNSLGLTTTHARICTEKGAAMDSLYIVDSDGNKVTDETRCEELRAKIEEIAASSDE